MAKIRKNPKVFVGLNINPGHRSECNYKYQNVDEYTKKRRIPKLVTEAMFCADSNLKDDVGTCYGDR